jgi:hypothetical protein
MSWVKAPIDVGSKGTASQRDRGHIFTSWASAAPRRKQQTMIFELTLFA